MEAVPGIYWDVTLYTMIYALHICHVPNSGFSWCQIHMVLSPRPEPRKPRCRCLRADRSTERGRKVGQCKPWMWYSWYQILGEAKVSEGQAWTGGQVWGCLYGLHVDRKWNMVEGKTYLEPSYALLEKSWTYQNPVTNICPVVFFNFSWLVVTKFRCSSQLEPTKLAAERAKPRAPRYQPFLAELEGLLIPSQISCQKLPHSEVLMIMVCDLVLCGRWNDAS